MLRYVIVMLIALLALWLRIGVATNAPENYDEDNYLSAARSFREHTNAGDWRAMLDESNNAEHPPLVKMLYSLSINEDELEDIPAEETLFRGSRYTLPPQSLQNTRFQSVLFGTLTVVIMALINPFAGLALALQSIHLNFSSLAYLDSLPTLFSALAVIFYVRGIHDQHRIAFVLSAICFGIAVAAKYPYGLVGVVVLLHALAQKFFSWRQAILWGLIGSVSFFIFNPYIWQDPPQRLQEQLQFHSEYATTTDERLVTRPIIQLITPNAHLPEFLQSQLWNHTDLAIFVLAALGMWVQIRDKSIYGWWLLAGLLFAMVWNTQWIQHRMLIMVPYVICAAAGWRWIWQEIIQPSAPFLQNKRIESKPPTP